MFSYCVIGDCEGFHCVLEYDDGTHERIVARFPPSQWEEAEFLCCEFQQGKR